MSEPILLPPDYDQMQPWFNILRHVNSVIAIANGSAMWVEIGIFIDTDGKPQFWTRPERHELNPKDREVTIRD